MNFSDLTPQQWNDLSISLIILAVAIIAGRWLIKLILDQGIRRIVGKTETTLDDTIFKAIKGPLHLLVIILVIISLGTIFATSRLVKGWKL